MMARTNLSGNDGKNFSRWYWWQKPIWVEEIARRETLWVALLGSLHLPANEKYSVLFLALEAARKT